jgi:hypothetical protein
MILKEVVLTYEYFEILLVFSWSDSKEAKTGCILAETSNEGYGRKGLFYQ